MFDIMKGFIMSEIITILNELTEPGYTEEKYLGADRAINAVCVKGPLGSFNEFKQILIEVILLIQNHVLKAQKTVEGAEEFYLGIAFRVLQKEYGPNGEKAAYEMSRTGKEGGINAVIRSLAYGYTDILFENEAKAKVAVIWEKLSNDQKFLIMDQYVSKFGYLWPDELTENGAVRLKMNFPKTLQLHIENIRKLTKSMNV